MLDLEECQNCEDVTLIKPFIVKTDQFLTSEYNISINSIAVTQLTKSVSIGNINFLTSLSGGVNTNLIFSFERSLAKAILDAIDFIEYTDDTFDELLFELVSEFLNLVVGRAMKDLPTTKSLTFSPPLEISGDSRLFCGDDFNICKIDITTEQGNMSMIFSTQIEKDK
jgi:CheY-specific phosphatase CheX